MITLPPMRISQGEPFSYEARDSSRSWVGYSGRIVFHLRRRSRRTPFNWNGYGYLSPNDPILAVAVTGDATGTLRFNLTSAQTLLFPSIPQRSFMVTSQYELTMGNGTDAKKYTGPVAVFEALDTVIQPGDSGGGVIVPPVVLPATNTVAPRLTGTGKIGAVHAVTTGTWANAVSYLYRWTRSGAVISGATLSTYTPTSADDSALLVGQVAGVNASGTVSAYVASNSIAVTYVAPSATDLIPNVVFAQSVAITPLPIAGYFTGSNRSYAYSPAIVGITLNSATGIFTGAPSAAAVTDIIVTATNSGGSATRPINVSVISSNAPALSGLTVSGGNFQYSCSTSGVAYWAVTDTSVSPLTGAQLEAQATGYDNDTFAVSSGAEIDAVAFTATPAGLRRAHLVVKNAGIYSNVQTYDFTFVIGDTVAPVLSGPTATQTGATTATGAVSTTEPGTLYRVLTTSVTPPSAPQVKLGQNNVGASAAFAGAQGVTASGAQNVTYTGLAASTVYYAYYMQEDAAGNQSNVAAAASITTAAAGGGGNPELLPDAGLDSAAAWTVPLGFAFTGGNVNINTTGLGNFLRLQNDVSSQRAAVSPSANYTFKATLNSVTTAGRVRIIVEEYTAAFNGSGGTTNATTLYDTDVDGAIIAGTVTKTFTMAATTNSVSYIFEATVPTLVAQLGSLSLKAT